MRTRFLVGMGVLGLVVAGCVAFCTAETRIEPPDVGGTLELLSGMEGRRGTVLAYHEPSRCLLVYGHTDEGIKLLQIKKLNVDLMLAARVGEMPYRSKGYDVADIQRQLEQLVKRARK
ncbi:MAG: hypothetical protein JXR37_09730 [Kiritimatiellae bacterium]|nr:hypothetical protein [Kiritimatiellia bacterium]